MIIQEKVKIKWSRNNKKHLIEKGYAFTNFNDIVEVSVSDLSPQSNAYIEYKCDYCNEKSSKKYSSIINGRKVISKDSCNNCRGVKTKESNLFKYNVENVNQLKEIREKAKETTKERYGVENVSQSEAIKNKKKQTCLKNWGVEYSLQNKEVRDSGKKTSFEKYGVEIPSKSDEIKLKTREQNIKKYGVSHPMKLSKYQEKAKNTNKLRYGYAYIGQVPELKEKRNMTFYQNGTQKTSSQQLTIFNMFKEKGFDVELNFPVNNLNLDIAIFIEKIKIDIEYDGCYWHQDSQKDRQRDEFLKTQGWKILRIKSNRLIPDFTDILSLINKLVVTDRTYSQIVLSDWKESSKEVVY